MTKANRCCTYCCIAVRVCAPAASLVGGQIRVFDADHLPTPPARKVGITFVLLGMPGDRDGFFADCCFSRT